MRQSGFYYIYPAYFEAGRTRQSGRRVPKKLAISNVDIELIVKAVRRLGLEYKVRAEARYSPSWWGTPGLVLIRKSEKWPKMQLLKEIAEIMKEFKAKAAS